MTAIITGSYKGIGRSIALELARNGYNTVINYRDVSKTDEAEKTAGECRKFGVKSEIFRADVSDESECQSLVEFTVDTFGGIEVLVNNAGVASYGLLTRLKEEEYRRIIACNQDSVFFMIKHTAKYMKKQRYGRIVNIASMAGVNGSVGSFAYSASKGAVIAMTKSASKEFAERNITVNAIAPGMIDTGLDNVVDPSQHYKIVGNIGMKRYGTCEEVASAVAYLTSEKAGYITGAVIEVHGGMVS